ncbi:hypothetical protein [Helicobacter pylori]|uniref:hypothetical protein n=1 Tax=Helicobacter pylori TaxID=210 RepID=UPI001E29E863|nr:hypothetical protein [Helicobacter pylori]
MKLPKDFEDYCEAYGNFNENGLEIFGTLKVKRPINYPLFKRPLNSIHNIMI